MQIKYITPQSNWQNRLEQNGFGYHTDENNIPYWVEEYYYSISEPLADEIYAATADLWQMCLQAVDHVITNKLYDQFQIPHFTRDVFDPCLYQPCPRFYLL